MKKYIYLTLLGLTALTSGLSAQSTTTRPAVTYEPQAVNGQMQYFNGSWTGITTTSAGRDMITAANVAAQRALLAGTSGATFGTLNSNWVKGGTTDFTGNISIGSAQSLFVGGTSGVGRISKGSGVDGFDFTTNAGANLRVITFPLFNSSDLIFQGTAVSGSTVLEDTGGSGLILSTSNTNPIYVRPNRGTAVADFNTAGTRIGVGATGGRINGILVGTATWDPGNTATGASASTTVTITGAAVGNVCTNPSWEDTTAGWTLSAWVSAADTVTLVATNTNASADDPASFTARVWVIKQ
jgi:hypothetical protein